MLQPFSSVAKHILRLTIKNIIGEKLTFDFSPYEKLFIQIRKSNVPVIRLELQLNWRILIEDEYLTFAEAVTGGAL